MCSHGNIPRPCRPCVACTLEAERDYYDARANDALEKGKLDAHEYWARKYHTQLGILSNRNVATEARLARQARDTESYTVAEIEAAFATASRDDWGVRCHYLSSLLSVLRKEK